MAMCVVMIQSHHPLGATPSTPTIPTTTKRGIGVIITTRLASRANGNRDPLHRPAMVVARWNHAVIDGEIAADQVRAHSGALAGEYL